MKRFLAQPTHSSERSTDTIQLDCLYALMRIECFAAENFSHFVSPKNPPGERSPAIGRFEFFEKFVFHQSFSLAVNRHSSFSCQKTTCTQFYTPKFYSNWTQIYSPNSKFSSEFSSIFIVFRFWTHPNQIDPQPCPTSTTKTWMHTQRWAAICVCQTHTFFHWFTWWWAAKLWSESDQTARPLV